MQIVELNKQLKIKQDSLVLVTSELLKYKPAPPKQEIVVKQDNTGPIKTVTIGTQVWMKENLNVSVFKNGVAIPEVKDNTAWEKAGDNHQPAWCYYDNDPKNGAKYGKLYNWYAVSKTTNGNKNVCPTGWHVPTYAEWTVLTDNLGGESVAGGKMKEVGTTSWNSPNTDATNTSLFSALPGGLRSDGGYYGGIGSEGIWWSSSVDNGGIALTRRLNYVSGSAMGYYGYKFFGLPVRCLKD